MVYCSDNAGFPYGSKSEAEVEERASQCLTYLQKTYRPQVMVIACNTASTVALPRARQVLSVPVIGVVPAIKTAASLSKNHCIGLLATRGTIKRPYTDQLIREFASHCEVIRIGSSELVHLVEQQLRGLPINQAYLSEILSPFFDRLQSPDHIVLGCTHFPLIKAELSISAPDVCWVDSGLAIARQVSTLVSQSETTPKQATHRAVFTQASDTIEALRPALHARGIDDVQLVAQE